MSSRKRRPGRPTIRTPEAAEAICDGLMEGKSLYSVLAQPGMPSCAAVCRWLVADAAFREQYARAREFQEMMLVDDMIEVRDIAGFNALKSRVGQIRPKKHGWW